MKNAQVLRILSAVLGLAWSSLALASNNCGTKPTSVPGTNQVAYELNDLQPYYSVEVGGVLGTASVSATIRCYVTYSRYRWLLQTRPNATGVYDPYTCDTPLNGVGVRYKDEGGGPVLCNARGGIFSIFDQRAGQSYPFYKAVAVEFIRTQELTSLPAGAHAVQLPPGALLDAHLPGGTSSQLWGNSTFSSSIPLLVTKCTFASVTTNVDFGSVSLGEIDGANVPFMVEMNNCGDEESSKLFNNAAKFEFLSADLSPEGYLNNQACAGCAKSVSIKLTDDNGVFLPLNKSYVLKNGTFQINEGRISHYFRAQLLNAEGDATAGRIQAVMTVVFSAI